MPLKIGGKVIDGPKKILLVLPRQDGDIPFEFVAVTDAEPFEKLYPKPKAPRKSVTGVGIVENLEDPKYIEQLEKRGEARQNWFFLESIKPSQIEWVTVDLGNCETWGNWRNDLKDAGFSEQERDRIWVTFLQTNVVSDYMVEEARSRFLAIRQAKLSAEQ